MEWNADAAIRLVGIGGTGVDVVEHLPLTMDAHVERIAIDTDKMVLRSISRSRMISLSIQGCPLTVDQERLLIRERVEENRNTIVDALTNARIVILVAGLGGSVGSVVTPIVAKLAEELGIPTVAVVSRPLMYEGRSRMATAVQAMQQLVDRTIVTSIIPKSHPHIQEHTFTMDMHSMQAALSERIVMLLERANDCLGACGNNLDFHVTLRDLPDAITYE